MHYASFGEAVADATRLAAAMTLKMAAADLPMGGGKSVIALPAPRQEISHDAWRRILEIHAANLATFRGSYWTGPDVGTSSADMDHLHGWSGFAFGRSEAAGGPGSSAPSTAQGVYAAMKAAAAEAGMVDLNGRTVVIQGVGGVGMDVLVLAFKDGADVVATDVDPELCRRARGLGALVVEPHEVLQTRSDVFVPCAMGGVIDLDVARSLQTKAVAGAANNVLTEPAAGDELARRGIVYAPDFVANAGGAIHLVGREVLGWSPEASRRTSTASLTDFTVSSRRQPPQASAPNVQPSTVRIHGRRGRPEPRLTRGSQQRPRRNPLRRPTPSQHQERP